MSETMHRRETIDRLTGWIRAAGLTGPAVLFLEASKPLAPLGSQILIMLQPLFGPGLAEYAALLEDPDGVDRVLDDLERRTAE